MSAEKTMEFSGHTIGTYCGPHSIRHLVRETCSGCGAKPGQACRRTVPGKAPSRLRGIIWQWQLRMARWLGRGTVGHAIRTSQRNRTTL